jgi:hypothetical protein
MSLTLNDKKEVYFFVVACSNQHVTNRQSVHLHMGQKMRKHNLNTNL